jgi:hypothetical protein
MSVIVISSGELSVQAELNESPTAQEIWKKLPLEGRANAWGDEIYFEVPVVMDQETDARAEVEVGELGYWPVGQAFCIFFGPTPVSTDERPRAYSPVNVIGRVQGDARLFKLVRDGDLVRIDRLED